MAREADTESLQATIAWKYMKSVTLKEIAKEAGDTVILDNDLISIAKAILYGRTIFKSIRKFIIFQLTVNLCAVSISIIGPFIGVGLPVTVIQMLLNWLLPMSEIHF